MRFDLICNTTYMCIYIYILYNTPMPYYTYGMEVIKWWKAWSQGPCSLRRTASCSLALFANFAPRRLGLGTAGNSNLAMLKSAHQTYMVGCSNQIVHGPPECGNHWKPMENMETSNYEATICRWFIWVCLKIGYIPNYSHLIGIMIINHWV